MNIPLSKQQCQYLIFCCIGIISILYAYHLRWVSEDAYISFRYARNLVEGHGLVFNPGERVEGYTNFLWTLLLALGLAAKLSLESISVILGLLCASGTLMVIFFLYRNIYDKPILFPAGFIAFALNYTWISFATSGLETSLVCLLVCSTFLLASHWSNKYPTPGSRYGHLVFAGTLVALAMLTRPDTVLIYPAIVMLILVKRLGRPQTFHAVLALTIPIAVVYAPYVLWRLGYYGFLFPNTFYAKAANLPYYSQGLMYIWEFIQRYFLWAFLAWPILAGCMALKDKKAVHPVILSMAAYCVLHSVYVVRVGGDFMEGRLLVPILPFIYLVIAYSLRWLWRNRTVLGISLAVLVASVVVNRPVMDPLQIQNGITDERSWAPQFERWFQAGAAFGKHLPPYTVVATDAVGAFGYSSRLPIVDTLGLTDKTVAHQPLKHRSRPGHEKWASPRYLQRRKVAIVRDGMGIYKFKRAPDFRFAGNRYFIVTRDQTVINGFKKAAAELRQNQYGRRGNPVP